jgi:eukaryotic-like serine/threonine-protein kinase
MSDDPRVERLLDELLDPHATPETVCVACPELLPVVRNRWLRMRRLRADLDALFPPSGESTPRPPEEPALPQIPGYAVEAILGRGGMGVVFKARHLRLDRPVALKMMLAGAYAGPREQDRFQREAEAVARLRHPNVVQIHDVGDSDGRPYFTMEYVEGGSLAQQLAGTPQPARQAAQLAATLAGAVQAAHACGIVHRDLKPGNVLVTADGTPKIADFGVARRLEAGAELTQSGVLVGTPSYVAPEQARGQTRAVGPAADTYALGAILYELLTGRPPFRAETAAETLLQVIHQDPAPPSRLNARVPRDLETICLKCLHKAPARRYASARELAEDLHRFLEGQPIRARPVGVAERAVKWARRRPAAALLVAALLVMVGAAVGSGVWLRQQEIDRRATKDRREGQAREAIATALKRANELRKEERFREAVQVLTDASPHAADAGSPDLAQQLKQAQADFRIAADLERARESRPLTPQGGIDYRQQAADYQEAFDRAGLRIGEDAEPVAASIRASALHEPIEAAIDDWAVVAFLLDDGPAVERLLRIARAADPEPHWRDRFRDPAAWQSTDRLQELADDAFTASPPPPGYQVALLGLLLRKKGGGTRTTLLLREACRRQPGNFWLCREMATALVAEGRLDEAAGYYRAALAVRPENAGAHAELGMVLFNTGQTDYELAELRRAVELAPDARTMQTVLVDQLAAAGYWKEAAAACRSALEADPHNPGPPRVLGNDLWHNRRSEDAVVLLRQAIEIDPGFVAAPNDLGLLFWQTGQHEEAANAFRAVTQLTPRDAFARQRLGLELAAAGHPAEAINALQAAIALRPKEFQFHVDLGRVLRSQGRLEEAADALRQATTIAPHVGWYDLAAVLLDQGRFVEARAATQRFLDLPANQAMSASRLAQQRQLDLCDSLHAIDAKLPAVLAGTERPTDVPTQLALAEWCLKHKRLTAMAASYYASVLSTQPSLADDPEAGIRFDAASAAALAGCGGGADAGKLDDRRRAELRKQAFDWLTAEYGAWAERHRLGKPGDHRLVATAVRAWLNNEDLAGVRDAQALARLPAEERRDWQALWEKAAALAARDPLELTLRAREHVSRREWAEAANCYRATFELEPADDADRWYEYAAAQLLAQDRPGYRRTCAQMLARGQATPPMRSYLVARACTLAPDSADDPELPGRLSVAELSGNSTAFWSLTEQAALAVRAGRSQEAVPLLERSLAADGRPGRAVLNWLWLALAYQKLGKPDAARRWLDRAANWLDQQGDQMPLGVSVTGLHQHNWLEAQVLRREAKALLRETSPEPSPPGGGPAP